MKHTINDVLRMAGHLLLAHPTTGELARDKNNNPVSPYRSDASSFSFMGAIWASMAALHVNHSYIFLEAQSVTGVANFRDWDTASPKARLRIASNLIKITAP